MTSLRPQRLVVPIVTVLCVAIPTFHSCIVCGFSLFETHKRQRRMAPLAQAARTSKASDGEAANGNSSVVNIDRLKAELNEYLEKRRTSNADEAARATVGKVIGGTKGNKILEYVSGAPNKATVIEDEPNIFDYDELTKYGYDHLVTPIMNAGGRFEMYKLMNLEAPAIKERKKKTAPELVIDRTGESDPARYSGLKMGQVLDDDEMARALEEANRKRKRGESLRPKLQEESFVKPFADNRNVGPRLTPNWTPEMLDEEGRKRGKAEAWARKAKAGEFVTDPFETLSLDGAIRLYSIFAAALASFAFGRATPGLFELLNAPGMTASGVQEVSQVPALAVVLAAVGSSVVNGVILAPKKNRNPFVWGVKGFFGGPVAIAELRSLDTLQTRGEKEAEMKREEANRS